MVLFKRKTVVPPPPSYTPSDPSQFVWVIPQTQEYFTSYDAYLERFDFYSQRKFICELTGSSCHNFFEALAKENQEIENLSQLFPEQIKEPILQQVQFNTTSRLDQLVDDVYSSVCDVYWPGEVVVAKIADQKLKSRVSEKVTYADGKVRYAVQPVDYPKTAPVQLSPFDLSRDKRLFSKFTLRAFIKHTANRDSRTGAPWVVKSEFVDRFGLRSQMPAELKKLLSVPPKAADPHSTKSKPSSVAPGQRESTPRKQRKGGTHNGGTGRNALSRREEDIIELMRLYNGVQPGWAAWNLLDGPADHLGQLLEIWLFLNFYNELLLLSPLSFDALDRELHKNSPGTVLSEVHSALLAQIVDDEDNEMLITWPQHAEDEPSEPPVKKRRGRKSRQQIELAQKQLEEERLLEEEKQQNASDDPFASVDWKEDIVGARDFSRGGWQVALACVLHELRQALPEWNDRLSGIIEVLVPHGTRRITKRSLTMNYTMLKYDQRIEALVALCRTLYPSPAVRNFIEQKGEELAKWKKELHENQKELKLLADRRRHMKQSGDASEADMNNIQEEIDSFVKIGESLRESAARSDCYRMQILGKDRFWNRYWWMEATGVDQDSRGLMGRIWVQGPCQEDIDIHLNSEKYSQELSEALKKHTAELAADGGKTKRRQQKEKHANKRRKHQANEVLRERRVDTHQRSQAEKGGESLQLQDDHGAERKIHHDKETQQKHAVLSEQVSAGSAVSNPGLQPTSEMQSQAQLQLQPQPQGHSHQQPQPQVQQNSQPQNSQPQALHQLPIQAQQLPTPHQTPYGVVFYAMPGQVLPQSMQLPHMAPNMQFQMPQGMVQGMQMYPVQQLPQMQMIQGGVYQQYYGYPQAYMSPQPQMMQYPYYSMPQVQPQAQMQPQPTPHQHHVPAQQNQQPNQLNGSTSQAQPPSYANPTAHPSIAVLEPNSQKAEASRAEDKNVPMKAEWDNFQGKEPNGPNKYGAEGGLHGANSLEPSRESSKELTVDNSTAEATPAPTEDTSNPDVDVKSERADTDDQTEAEEPAVLASLTAIDPLKLKMSTEGEQALNNSDDWGYFDTFDSVKALQSYLLPHGRREGRLFEEISKLLPGIETSMNARLQRLENGEQFQWTNELAKEKTGRVFCPYP